MFHSPTSISITGCSGSGKTYFTFRLIENRNELFSVPPIKIMYRFGVWHSMFAGYEKSIDFREGLPNKEEIGEFADSNHNLLILDDLMMEIIDSKEAAKIFTMYSHHMNISVIFLNQNMFSQGKAARTISLNLHYMIIFRNPRDTNQIRVLAQQTGLRKALIEAFEEESAKKYGYLVLDLSPESSENYQISTNIFPCEYKTVYIPNK